MSEIDLNLGFELRSERFLAFDVSSGMDFRPLIDVVASWADRNVLNYEWNNSRRLG